MHMAKSRFTGANTAKISEKAEKLSDGDHLLEITKITMSEEGKNGDYYVVEFKVRESNSGKDTNSGRDLDPVGATRAWTQTMDKKAFPLPKLNAFAFAAAGYDNRNPQDSADISNKLMPQASDILDATVDESDPLGFIGRLVRASAKTIDSKNIDPKTQKPFKFVVHSFSPGQPEKMDLG